MSSNDAEIINKIIIYKSLFKELLKKCKIAKSRLDMLEEKLRSLNTFIQLSVIYFSGISTFIQAVSTNSYSVIFSSFNNDIDNSTEIFEDELYENNESTIEKEAYVSIISLGTALYSSLIISAARHIKIEERAENISTLTSHFSELINRIQYEIDNLKLSANNRKCYAQESGESTLVSDDGGNTYVKEDPNNRGSNSMSDWIILEKTINKEYTHILEKKKDLFISYEKIINASVYRRYKKLFNKLKVEYESDDSDNEFESVDDYKKQRQKKKLNCCANVAQEPEHPLNKQVSRIMEYENQKNEI